LSTYIFYMYPKFLRFFLFHALFVVSGLLIPHFVAAADERLSER